MGGPEIKDDKGDLRTNSRSSVTLPTKLNLEYNPTTVTPDFGLPPIEFKSPFSRDAKLGFAKEAAGHRELSPENFKLKYEPVRFPPPLKRFFNLLTDPASNPETRTPPTSPATDPKKEAAEARAGLDDARKTVRTGTWASFVKEWGAKGSAAYETAVKDFNAKVDAYMKSTGDNSVENLKIRDNDLGFCKKLLDQAGKEGIDAAIIARQLLAYGNKPEEVAKRIGSLSKEDREKVTRAYSALENDKQPRGETVRYISAVKSPSTAKPIAEVIASVPEGRAAASTNVQTAPPQTTPSDVLALKEFHDQVLEKRKRPTQPMAVVFGAITDSTEFLTKLDRGRQSIFVGPDGKPSAELQALLTDYEKSYPGKSQELLGFLRFGKRTDTSQGPAKAS